MASAVAATMAAAMATTTTAGHGQHLFMCQHTHRNLLMCPFRRMEIFPAAMQARALATDVAHAEQPCADTHTNKFPGFAN
jgi:hypothetical protein